MIETALEEEGRVGVIVPHGVLFRGGAEGKIRQKLLEDNMLEAVIGLPVNLFFGTGIPAAIVIFNKARKPWSEAWLPTGTGRCSSSTPAENSEDDKNQNRLRAEDIAKILQVFGAFQDGG